MCRVSVVFGVSPPLCCGGVGCLAHEHWLEGREGESGALRQGWGVRYPEAIQTTEVWVALEERTGGCLQSKNKFCQKGRNLVEIDTEICNQGHRRRCGIRGCRRCQLAAQTAVLNGADVGGLQILSGAGKSCPSVLTCWPLWTPVRSPCPLGLLALLLVPRMNSVSTHRSFRHRSIQSAVIDTASMKYMSVAVAGGATQTSVANKVTTGGSLTVGSLNVDLVKRRFSPL